MNWKKQVVLWRCLAAGLLLSELFGCAGMSAVDTLSSGTANTVVPDAVYQLQAGDEVDVQVYREPLLSGEFRLDAGGTIRHPLAGVIQARGLTVEALEDRVAALLEEKYLVNPRVTVSIVSAQSSHVVILGEVKNPGVHPIPFGSSLTLLQAVAEAGGFTDLASVNRITVTRTENGEERSVRVRVSRMISGEDPDVPLKPNDVIMVPQIVF